MKAKLIWLGWIRMERRGIAFGIVSYLPSREPDRSLRKERLDRLFRNVKNVFGNVRYLIVAQNWGDYRMPPFVRADVFRHERGLGILKARNELRSRFLSSGADWLVMLDDDCMIRETAADAGRRFLKSLEGREEGFCFRKDGKGEYCPSQLNLCAISKGLYGKEPLPPIDPEKDEGFEDLTWSNFLHFKHPEMEFDVAGLECTHFKNPDEKAPSTWADEKPRDWQRMLDFSYGCIEEFRKGNFDWEDILAKRRKDSLEFASKAEANAKRRAWAEEALLRGWVTEADLGKFLDGKALA